MTKKTIKASDVLGDNYYIYELTSSNYTPALNGSITITCTMKDVYGAVASGKSITLYQNGTSKGAQTTNSSGVATWSITCSTAGLQKFNIKDTNIEVFVDNKSDIGHTHTVSNVTDFPSTMTPSSHTHGNLQNNGQVGSTAQASKNVVTDSSGKITTEDKPTIPSASSTVPSADTTSGSYGSSTAYARSNHTHPKSSLYAESSHTHGNLSNDGKLTTSHNGTYSTFIGVQDSTGTLYKASKINSDIIIDGTAHANIGSNANDNQSAINTAINTALGNKANASSLSTVATSGSYSDLSNKPTLSSLGGTVTVEKQSTAESGYAHTYIVKQNGTQVGSKINIPKDFLVKSATLNTCSTANNPVSGYVVGDKYLDFVINTKDNSATDEHLYVLVSDLVDDMTVDSALSSSSENPVQNKVVKTALDGKIDSSLTYATATGNNDEILCKTSDDGKIHTTRAIQANWVKDLIAHTGSGGIGSADGDAQSSINTKINTALVNLKADKEDSSNKVTSLSSSSTNTQYPSAKLVYDQLNNKAPTSHASTATTYGVSNASNYGHSMASSTSPQMNGTAAVGSETAKFARGDHVHPTDTSRAPTSHASTANTYGLGSASNYGHVKTINGLTQSSHSDGTALSAYQGKVLNDTKADKSSVVDWDNIVFVDKTDDDTGSIILNFLA